MNFGTLIKKASINKAPEDFTDRIMAQIDYLPKHQPKKTGELLSPIQKWILSLSTLILLIGTTIFVFFNSRDTMAVSDKNFPSVLEKFNQFLFTGIEGLDPVFISALVCLIILSFLFFDHILRNRIKRKIKL